MTNIEPLCLEIAGITFGIHLPFEEWRAPVVERYAAFLTAAPPAWQVVVDYDPALVDPEAPCIRHEGTLTTFHLAGMRGVVDLAAHRTQASALSETDMSALVERLLAFICVEMLPRKHDAFLLHASGVVMSGAGYVFFGRSGIGKTTVAGLVGDRGEVLSDELVAVHLGAGGPELVSTPFWGVSIPPERIRRVNRRAPLVGLFELAQAETFSLKRLSATEAVLALLGMQKAMTELLESTQAWLAVAEQMVRQAPVYRLGFRPTAALWPFLERALG